MSNQLPPQAVVVVPAWRLSGLGGKAELPTPVREVGGEQVVVESVVALSVNGRTLLRFSCLPDRIEDLALGFLVTEGLVDGPSQVTAVAVAEGKVNVTANVDFDRFVQFFETVSMVSGCGRGGSGGGGEEASRVRSPSRFTPEACLDAMRQLEHASSLFRATGGVHLAALSAGEGLLALAEDVGRHNAVDKVIGGLLRSSSGQPSLTEVMLLSTGRLSREIVAKATRVGIPLLVSRSAPTSAGVTLARRSDLCLVGFARGQRLNVYSSPWRLGLPGLAAPA